MPTLDLSSLQKATHQLKKNLGKAQAAQALGDMDDFDSYRTACIKGFELVFELSQKFIRRALGRSGRRWRKKNNFFL